MALVTSSQVSSLSVALLTRTLVLPMTVARVPGGEFSGPNGATVTVRVRQPRSANTQSTPGASITITGIDETSVNVTVNHLYDAASLTDEDLSLGIEDFGMQVTEPQVASVATGAEDELAAAMNAVTADDTLDISPASGTVAEETDRVVKAAREALSEADVPAGDRFLACAPDIITQLLGVDKFVRADATGDSRSTALRDAIMGRIYGFTVIESNGLTAGTAVAYHRSGFVFANRVPVTPRGAVESSTATSGGVGMRHIFQYDPSTLSDQSVLSTFAGGAVVDLDRVFKFDSTTT